MAILPRHQTKDVLQLLALRLHKALNQSLRSEELWEAKW